MSKVARICVAVTMVAAPAVLLASPASASTMFLEPGPDTAPGPGHTLANPELATLPLDDHGIGPDRYDQSLTVTLSDIEYSDSARPLRAP